MNTNQTSDSAQNGGASGTKVTSVSPRESGFKGTPPATTNPSGSSQAMIAVNKVKMALTRNKKANTKRTTKKKKK